MTRWDNTKRDHFPELSRSVKKGQESLVRFIDQPAAQIYGVQLQDSEFGEIAVDPLLVGESRYD